MEETVVLEGEHPDVLPRLVLLPVAGSHSSLGQLIKRTQFAVISFLCSFLQSLVVQAKCPLCDLYRIRFCRRDRSQQKV
ncbi:uncharacterized protein LOC144589475 isoform X3 [Pogona vitticeps]